MMFSWFFSKVNGVTIFTVSGHAAILIVSAIGAGVGAQIGITVRTSFSTTTKVVRRSAFVASSGRSSPVPKDAWEQFAWNSQHSDTETTRL